MSEEQQHIRPHTQRITPFSLLPNVIDWTLHTNQIHASIHYLSILIWFDVLIKPGLLLDLEDVYLCSSF